MRNPSFRSTTTALQTPRTICRLRSFWAKSRGNISCCLSPYWSWSATWGFLDSKDSAKGRWRFGRSFVRSSWARRRWLHLRSTWPRALRRVSGLKSGWLVFLRQVQASAASCPESGVKQIGTLSSREMSFDLRYYLKSRGSNILSSLWGIWYYFLIFVWLFIMAFI